MSDANRQIISDAYAAFGRGDAAAVLGAFSPDIVWNEAENIAYADRNPYLGPAAVGEGVFGRLMAEWEGFTVTPEKLVAEDDTVVALGRYTATHRTTGRPLNAQFVHAWTLRDGQITHFQQYADTLQFAQASNVAQAAALPLSV